MRSADVYNCQEYLIISCKEDFLKFYSKINSAIIIDCVQRNKKTNEVYLEDIEFGIYPHVNKLKDEIQKNLEVVQKFKSDNAT